MPVAVWCVPSYPSAFCRQSRCRPLLTGPAPPPLRPSALLPAAHQVKRTTARVDLRRPAATAGPAPPQPSHRDDHVLMGAVLATRPPLLPPPPPPHAVLPPVHLLPLAIVSYSLPGSVVRRRGGCRGFSLRPDSRVAPGERRAGDRLAMADLSAFADAGFDPKAFINQACADKTGEEPLERCAGAGEPAGRDRSSQERPGALGRPATHRRRNRLHPPLAAAVCCTLTPPSLSPTPPQLPGGAGDAAAPVGRGCGAVPAGPRHPRAAAHPRRRQGAPAHPGEEGSIHS